MEKKRCIPAESQLDFLNWEFGVFFHFGIRTFYEGHKDWDLKDMPLSGFYPTDFSAEDWCEKIAAGGAKYAILTAKHHDGFANWPSAYTEYSVKNTPWRDGKGDVVGDFVAACRKFGLKVGLYYSPAQFGSVNVDHDEYDTYFINQISELLTNYGKIDYLWFDGCGSANHNYNQERIIKSIRALQPEILIFNMWDPDTAWVGNEDGYARYPNVYEKNVASMGRCRRESDSEEGTRFLPDECDCRIRDTWFYEDADRDNLKSVDMLMGMYELSVGRGSNLLLNIGPDRRGRLLDEDVARINEFAAEVKRRYSNPIPVDTVYDDNGLYIYFPQPTDANCVVLEEDIVNGQSVFDFELSFFNCEGNDYYKTVLFHGSTVGRKLIISFPPMRLRRLRLDILRSEGDWKLNSVKVFKY
ncbi:MAG: alpha-L-fucosidase [Clostridia bacterium]|nr:alpha-L-fucosidase [Clostridia bacterium]